jgi:hypothetical protein
MKTQNDKITEKLRKLIAKQESAISIGNEAEANVFAAKINELLIQYNLEMNEVLEAAEENANLMEKRNQLDCFKYKNIGGTWEIGLLHCITANNFCRTIRSTWTNSGKGSTINRKAIVLGRKENVETCLWLWDMLRERFVKIAEEKHIEYCKTNKKEAFGTYARNFLNGCVSGLWEKFRQEEKERRTEKPEFHEKVSSMALVRRDEIDVFEKEAVGGTTKGRNHSSGTLLDAKMQGYQVGRSTNINRGLSGNGTVTAAKTALK